MYRYLRKKRIKRNGKRAGGGDVLCEGDTLSLYIGDEFLRPPARHAGFPPPRVVYEDEKRARARQAAGTAQPRRAGGGHADKPRPRLSGGGRRVRSRGGDELCARPVQPARPQHGRAGAAAKTAAALRALNAYIRGRSIRRVLQLPCAGLSRPAGGGSWRATCTRTARAMSPSCGNRPGRTQSRCCCATASCSGAGAQAFWRWSCAPAARIRSASSSPGSAVRWRATPSTGTGRSTGRSACAGRRCLQAGSSSVFRGRPVLGGLAGRTVELPPPIDRCP